MGVATELDWLRVGSSEIILCYDVMKTWEIMLCLARQINSSLFQASAAVLMRSALLTLEDGTDTLSRNVGKQLLHDAA